MVIKGKKKRPRDLPEKLGKIRQLPIDSSDALSLSFWEVRVNRPLN